MRHHRVPNKWPGARSPADRTPPTRILRLPLCGCCRAKPPPVIWCGCERSDGSVHYDKLVREWSGPQLDGVGIGHTRWATHRTVTEGNAHPHTDCGGRISVVHNGIIENEGSLRDALTGAGRRFATSVDSEVLCHLIEEQRQHCGDLVNSAAQPGRPGHAVD